MMRKVVLVLMLALAATPAAAQGGLEGLHSSGKVKNPVEEEREKKIDNDYRKALNSIPDAKASNDPWGTVRQAPSSTKAPQR